MIQRISKEPLVRRLQTDLQDEFKDTQKRVLFTFSIGVNLDDQELRRNNTSAHTPSKKNERAVWN